MKLQTDEKRNDMLSHTKIWPTAWPYVINELTLRTLGGLGQDVSPQQPHRKRGGGQPGSPL